MKWDWSKKRTGVESKPMPVTIRFHNEEKGFTTQPFWSCDKCKIVYDLDEIGNQVTMPNGDIEIRCRACGTKMLSGEKDWYEKNYNLKPLP